MIKLVQKEKPKGIWVADMKDGSVGVIVSWTNRQHLGAIVQRYYNDLVGVGMRGETGWSKSFNPICSFSTDCRIRLLEKGETLVVT